MLYYNHSYPFGPKRDKPIAISVHTNREVVSTLSNPFFGSSLSGGYVSNGNDKAAYDRTLEELSRRAKSGETIYLDPSQERNLRYVCGNYAVDKALSRW